MDSPPPGPVKGTPLPQIRYPTWTGYKVKPVTVGAGSDNVWLVVGGSRNQGFMPARGSTSPKGLKKITYSELDFTCAARASNNK